MNLTGCSPFRPNFTAEGVNGSLEKAGFSSSTSILGDHIPKQLGQSATYPTIGDILAVHDLEKVEAGAEVQCHFNSSMELY